MAETILARHLGELFSREEKKLIPCFDGHKDGKLIYDFLEIANRISINNNWDDFQKVRNFADRLTGVALEWHDEFMSDLPINPSSGNFVLSTPVDREKYTRANLPYEIWEKAFIDRFTNIGKIERLRNELNNMKQGPDQDIQSFISNLNHLYYIVNGSAPKLSINASNQEIIFKEENERIRDRVKVKILLGGILPELRKEIWSRMEVNPTYEQACKSAIESEIIVINKRKSDL